MQLRACGDLALLVDLPDEQDRRAWDHAIRLARDDGTLGDRVVEHVAASRTVLVRVRSTSDLAPVAATLRDLPVGEAAPSSGQHPLLIPVRYDGADLGEVAGLLSMTPQQVVHWHTSTSWFVDFAGFSPGFGYLRATDGGPSVRRRRTPRTRIPPGSVALAGHWSGIYPSASPGGWQLIGRTELPVWDAGRNPPALLTPGRRVRFEQV